MPDGGFPVDRQAGDGGADAGGVAGPGATTSEDLKVETASRSMADPEATAPHRGTAIDLNGAARQVFQLWIDLAVIDVHVTHLSAEIANVEGRITAQEE